MNTRFQVRPSYGSVYLWSAAFLLAMTACLKLISLGGVAPILRQIDPVLGVGNRSLLFGAAVTELLVAGFLVVDRRTEPRCYLKAWLASVFVVYRIALWRVAPGKSCHCLGTLADRLPMTPHTVDLLLRLAIAYLLVGSVFFLVRARANPAPGRP